MGLPGCQVVGRPVRHLAKQPRLRRTTLPRRRPGKPERLALGEHPVKRGLVGQQARQDGAVAPGPGLQRGERGADRLAQAAADADLLAPPLRTAVRAGHLAAVHEAPRRAAASALAMTSLMMPSLSCRILTASVDLGRVSSQSPHPGECRKARRGHREAPVRAFRWSQRWYAVGASRPRARARSTASARRCAPSWVCRLRMWVLTVLCETCSSRAISGRVRLVGR